MAFNQRLIVVQIPINAREKRKRKKRSFAHFVFNFCSFRFCDYNKNGKDNKDKYRRWYKCRSWCTGYCVSKPCYRYTCLLCRLVPGKAAEGYSVWKNPFNGVKSYVAYDKTRLIVFWSKNPAPLLKGEYLTI